MIAVVDYKKGNLKSVERGLEACGASVKVTDKPHDLLVADAVVLPGVGAYTDAMDTLEETRQAQALRRAVAEGTPFLGICLGMHLMFDAGEEHAQDGSTQGLGILPGTVRHLESEDAAGAHYKVPHVGWNTVQLVGTSSNTFETAYAAKLFEGVPEGSYFYFTHSYRAPDSAYTAGVTDHAVTFPSVVTKGNAFGVQFHPEKSSDAGMRLLKNFVLIASELQGM